MGRLDAKLPSSHVHNAQCAPIGPGETEDTTDHVPPHLARDFSLPRDSVCINSRMITAHQHTGIRREEEKERNGVYPLYDLPEGRKYRGRRIS